MILLTARSALVQALAGWKKQYLHRYRSQDYDYVTQWIHDTIIASILRQNDVATLFWRHNKRFNCVVCPLGTASPVHRVQNTFVFNHCAWWKHVCDDNSWRCENATKSYLMIAISRYLWKQNATTPSRGWNPAVDMMPTLSSVEIMGLLPDT